MYLVITENRPQLADFAEGSKKKNVVQKICVKMSKLFCPLKISKKDVNISSISINKCYLIKM